jgi:curved DNA-binding protein CbpA
MTERPLTKRRPSSLYEVLQVAPRAEPEVIKASYRTLARIYHPDVSDNPESAARMREINAAYDVLSDPTKRALYDAERAWHPQRASNGGRAGTVARSGSPAQAVTLRSTATPAFRGRLVLLVLALLGMLTLLLWLVLEMLNEAPPALIG